jgi:hypothetical protein
MRVSLGQEALVQDLFDRPRADLGKRLQVQARLINGIQTGSSISQAQALRRVVLQAPVLSEIVGNLLPGVADTEAPEATRVGGWIILPLEEV